MAMKRMNAVSLAVVAALTAAAVVQAAPAGDVFVRETEAWRAERVARLTTADGWLTLAGLHFLKRGESTIGSAKENDVVLVKGPARLGRVILDANGRVTLTLAAEADALIDGRRARTAELKPAAGTAPATLVSVGTMSFFVVDPNGRRALRVKDSASPRRTEFAGLDYFPIDPTWRIEARWEAFERSRMIPVTDVRGQTGPALVPGKAVFERDGKTFELLPIDEGRDRPLFFVISDATSGNETYGAARFVYADWPKDGKVILDFNRAENPPCAFTPFSMCPLPPKENRLPFAVRAGEKSYRGHDE